MTNFSKNSPQTGLQVGKSFRNLTDVLISLPGRALAAAVGTTKNYQWLTTAPNPRSAATGCDAGQRGWKLHAVKAQEGDKFTDLGRRVALCGMRPRHGWSLDLFVEDRCSRCVKKLNASAVI